MNKKEPMSFTLGVAGSVVRDPSFPRVAAKAALELDSELLRKRHQPAPEAREIQAVRTLAGVVRGIAEKVRDLDSLHAMMVKLDPATTNVFLRAYDTAGERIEVKQFPAETTRVAEVLEEVAKHPKPRVGEADLIFARNFCQALSSQAAGRTRLSPSSPTHAFLRKIARWKR